MSVMPASSTQGRTLLPAVTPVPGRAGTRTTVLAPLVPLTVVRDRRALEVDLEHLLARVLGGLFDGGRNFVGLAVTDADVAAAIAGDDERAEAEGSAALDDLGAAIDADDGGFDAGFVAFAIATPPRPPRRHRTAAALSAAAAATTTTAATTAAAATAPLLRAGLAGAAAAKLPARLLPRRRPLAAAAAAGVFRRVAGCFFSHVCHLSFSFRVTSVLGVRRR